MSQIGPYQERIRHKLGQKFTPLWLEVVDDSKRHAGHAGHDPRGETHFKISIVSTIFEGLSAVARHRLVYEALKTEMQERIHALNLQTMTPEEYNQK